MLQGVEFLSPTVNDKFTVETRPDKSKVITIDKSFIAVKADKTKDGGVDLQLIDSHFESPWHSKKLWGYVLFKIVAGV